MDKQPVIVVGAGPTGLALACDLLQRGVEVVVIDKATGPSTTSRALGVHARAREVLQRLGALGDLPERAVQAVGTNLYMRKRRVARLIFSAVGHESTAKPLLIGQAAIEAQLRARLQELGGKVLWDHALVGVDQTLSGVEINVRAGGKDEVWRGAWLVGCDGAHSQVRKASGIAFEGVPFPELMVLADVEVDWHLRAFDRTLQESVVWLHPNGFVGAMPLPGGVWRIFADIPLDDPLAEVNRGAMTALNDPSITQDKAVLARLQQLLDERSGEQSAVVRNPTWISVFRFHRRLAGKYRQGRILLAGDAAHIYNALGGQGMNTGLMDAANLGWKLALVARGQAGSALLDTYESERRPVAASVVKNTTRAYRVLLGSNFLSRCVRDYVFFPVLRAAFMQRRLLYMTSQLRTHYRRGPLARRSWLDWLGHWLRSGPQAGDRAPDAMCLRLPDGATVTLQDVVRTHWTLLLFGDPADSPLRCAESARAYLRQDLRVVHVVHDLNATDAMLGHADVVLHDTSHALEREWKPKTHQAALIRPDGHIAWRGSWLHAAAMTAWLARIIDAEAAAAAEPLLEKDIPEGFPRPFKPLYEAQHRESARR